MNLKYTLCDGKKYLAIQSSSTFDIKFKYIGIEREVVTQVQLAPLEFLFQSV